MSDIPRNALGPAYEAAAKAATGTGFSVNPNVCYAANLLEIVSRRRPIRLTPALQQELHDLFQAAAPALDEAEHLFNAALAGETTLHRVKGEVVYA